MRCAGTEKAGFKMSTMHEKLKEKLDKWICPKVRKSSTLMLTNKTMCKQINDGFTMLLGKKLSHEPS